ncbi:MAG: MFS transporter [Chloroflexi bacterium]|nr:MFS transporter [Chloroflexota bacterium]
MEEAKATRVWGLQRNVFVLGLASFLQDVSSEMVYTILPLFLANVLGVKTSVIGLIEGVADSTATLLKVVSGTLSDRIGHRKAMTAWGYGLSAISKPFLYFVRAWGLVLILRFVDRVGKGVRTSPRDALLADSVTPEERGKSFGFHRAMDSAGAVVGLAGAAVIVYLIEKGGLQLTRSAFQTLVLASLIPGVLGVLIILLFVREAARVRGGPKGPTSDAGAEQPFNARFKVFLGIMTLFTLGNSSDAFLLLRAQNLGASVFHILLILVLFNVVYTAISYPAGRLSDRLGRRALMIGGWGTYALIYFGFAAASTSWQVLALFGFYGIYYGATEGVARAFVADMVGAGKRGTAYGLYNGAIGVTALPASVIAGFLWQTVSPAAPFYFGAALAAVAMVLLASLVRE